MCTVDLYLSEHFDPKWNCADWWNVRITSLLDVFKYDTKILLQGTSSRSYSIRIWLTLRHIPSRQSTSKAYTSSKSRSRGPFTWTKIYFANCALCQIWLKGYGGRFDSVKITDILFSFQKHVSFLQSGNYLFHWKHQLLRNFDVNHMTKKYLPIA